jgi:hypothetical protein
LSPNDHAKSTNEKVQQKSPSMVNPFKLDTSHQNISQLLSEAEQLQSIANVIKDALASAKKEKSRQEKTTWQKRNE